MRVMLTLWMFQPSAGKIGMKQVGLGQSKPNTSGCWSTLAESPGTGDRARMWWPLGILKAQLLPTRLAVRHIARSFAQVFLPSSPQRCLHHLCSMGELIQFCTALRNVIFLDAAAAQERETEGRGT